MSLLFEGCSVGGLAFKGKRASHFPPTPNPAPTSRLITLSRFFVFREELLSHPTSPPSRTQRLP